MRKAACDIVAILGFSLIVLGVQAQNSDTAMVAGVNKKRLRSVAIAGTAAYSISLVALNHLWYSDQPRKSFHFFNDNVEWKQVDKVGHFYSSYYVSYGTTKTLAWCGVEKKKSILFGSLTGFLLLLPIEIMDGHSSAYGASAGDLLANATGAAFYMGQALLWDKPRIIPKFSFHESEFASLRPETLGETSASQVLKDYNGQTYWLSVDMDKFVRFPKWLNIAAGYGASDMVYARDGVNSKMGYDAYRQFYLSVDPDLSAINTQSKFLKTVLFVVGMIKIPSPTVEFSTKGTVWHWLY